MIICVIDYELQRDQRATSFVFHLEVFYNILTDEIIFLEIACSSGGNNISYNWSKVFGINLFKEQINLALGKLFLIQSPAPQPKFLYGSFNIPTKTGTLISIPSHCYTASWYIYSQSSKSRV